MPNTIDIRLEFLQENWKKAQGYRFYQESGSNGRHTYVGSGKKLKRGVIEKRGPLAPTGLLASNVIYLPLYSHKEPTILCHYVTKNGIIAQQGLAVIYPDLLPLVIEFHPPITNQCLIFSTLFPLKLFSTLIFFKFVDNLSFLGRNKNSIIFHSSEFA